MLMCFASLVLAVISAMQMAATLFAAMFQSFLAPLEPANIADKSSNTKKSLTGQAKISAFFVIKHSGVSTIILMAAV